jgi:hydrogenase nickel incorporation protein HypA/HybF
LKKSEMHELSIAASVVEKVLEFVDSHPVKEVLEVRLMLGELVGVEQEQLRFCYSAITKETALENSVLEFDAVEAFVQCPHCAYHGRPKYWEEALSFVPVATLQCPECGMTVRPSKGSECAIKTIRYAV